MTNKEVALVIFSELKNIQNDSVTLVNEYIKILDALDKRDETKWEEDKIKLEKSLKQGVKK